MILIVKKVIIAITCLLTMALAFTGCNNKVDEDNPVVESTTKATTVSEKVETTTVTTAKSTPSRVVPEDERIPLMVANVSLVPYSDEYRKNKHTVYDNGDIISFSSTHVAQGNEIVELKSNQEYLDFVQQYSDIWEYTIRKVDINHFHFFEYGFSPKDINVE